MKKKIILASEKKERLTIRKKSAKPKRKSFCRECFREVEWLSLDEAVTATGKTAKSILRENEAGKIHSTETESGHLIFCPVSIV